jgi:hypothetical protein
MAFLVCISFSKENGAPDEMKVRTGESQHLSTAAHAPKSKPRGTAHTASKLFLPNQAFRSMSASQLISWLAEEARCSCGEQKKPHCTEPALWNSARSRK